MLQNDTFHNSVEYIIKYLADSSIRSNTEALCKLRDDRVISIRTTQFIYFQYTPHPLSGDQTFVMFSLPECCVFYYRRLSIIDGRVLIHCSSVHVIFLSVKNELNEK